MPISHQTCVWGLSPNHARTSKQDKAYPFFGLTKMAIHAWQVSLNYLHFAADHHWMNSERFLFCGCHVMLLVIPCELPWPGLVGFPTNKFRATNKFTSQVLLLVGKKKNVSSRSKLELVRTFQRNCYEIVVSIRLLFFQLIGIVIYDHTSIWCNLILLGLDRMSCCGEQHG